MDTRTPSKPTLNVSLCSTEMFAATGWRVGWLIGPPDLIRPTLAATTRIVFCTNSPLQEAAAAGLEQARERKFFEVSVKEYAERREVLASVFREIGLPFTLPEGTYFLLLVSPSITLFLVLCFYQTTLKGYISRQDPRGLPLARDVGREGKRLQVGISDLLSCVETHDPSHSGWRGGWPKSWVSPPFPLAR